MPTPSALTSSSPADTSNEEVTSPAEKAVDAEEHDANKSGERREQKTADTKHFSMKDFKIKKKVGGGAEGAVYLADNLTKDTDEPLSDDGEVAIKSVVCHSDDEIAMTRKELNFLMTLKHGNIVNHMAFWDEKHKSFLGEETRFYLVMEYCRGGSLEDYILARKKQQKNFDHVLIESYACQICECMMYMHSQSIIHRDIKPENILLMSDMLQVKVCDFGFTKKFDAVLTGTVLGTVVYMAPEIFENKKYDESVDIWSLGVVLLQLLLLKTQREVPDVRIYIQNKPNFVREVLKDCGSRRIMSACEACLKIDPVERPTAQEILEFFQSKDATDIRKKVRATSHFKLSSSDIGNNPLDVIKSEKGREFWRSCEWGEKMQVSWLEFREAYQKFMNWKRMVKDQERGLKKILVFVPEGSDSEQISCYSFHEAIETCGFPFNLDVLYAIEKYREVAESGPKRNYSLPMSPEEFEEARSRYLQMIIEHDKIFVDPVSQETLSVDQHCAPLKLVTDEEWDVLMESEYDMDHEDDKLLRLERLGQAKDQSQHENAIDYLVSQKGHKYIILGAAAAGKSTMMRLLMYKAALRAKEDPSYLIPIFVPICNLSSFPSDMDFRLKCIRSSADSMLNRALRYPDNIEHFLMTVIRKQKALLLMDGLDEAATAENRRDIEHSIHDIGESKSMGTIVTSRVSGFEHDDDDKILFSEYTLARVQPLSYDIQAQIAGRRGITDEAFFQSLKGKYSELAKTPLLLSLMIQEFKRSNSLPDVRAQLYEQAIDTMIDIYFEKTRSDMKFSERKKLTSDLRSFLVNLACYLHNSRKRDFVDSEIDSMDGAEKIWHEVLRPDIDHGKFSLVIVLNDKYRFSHLSFQEYFVASTWADSKKESEIRLYERQWLGLGQAQLNFSTDKVKNLIIDPWYRETFLLCAGAMSKDDFMKWANFLLRLYKKQGHVIDSIVYNMVRERPDSEQNLYKDIIKQLNSEKKLKIVLDGLIHQSEDLREMALSRVRLYNDFHKISKHLIKHLSDDNQYAAEALSIVIPHGDPDTVQRLLGELSNKDPKIRSKVCFVLGNISAPNDQKAVKAVLKLVSDANTNVLKNACEALCKIAKIGDRDVLHALDVQLDDYARRAPAAEALGIIAEPLDKFVIGRLSKICKMCEEAAYALGKLASKTDRGVVDTLVECIKENSFDDSKIIAAVGMLAERNNHESQDYLIGKLIDLLNFRKRKIAYRAAGALGAVVDRGDEEVVSRLLELLEDTTSRERVVCALGFTANKGDDNVIQALLRLLGDKSLQYIVREQCAIALSKLAKRSDKVIIDALCARLGDTEEVVNAVADALLTISDKDNEDVLNAFLQLTQHPDTGVVEHACQILGKVTSRGNAHVIETLLKILSNTTFSEMVRSVAAESLGLVALQDDQSIIDKLVEYVQQETAIYIRQFSVRAVANLVSARNNEKVVDTLFQMTITEGNVVVKEETINTLARICDPRHMIELLRNRTYKSYRPVIFSIVVKAIRLLREEDPNWTLGQTSIELVQKIKSIESQYVLMESSSSI